MIVCMNVSRSVRMTRDQIREHGAFDERNTL
jgi:hypothetical protein